MFAFVMAKTVVNGYNVIKIKRSERESSKYETITFFRANKLLQQN